MCTAKIFFVWLSFDWLLAADCLSHLLLVISLLNRLLFLKFIDWKGGEGRYFYTSSWDRTFALKQNLFGKLIACRAGQEITRFIWNPEVLYCVYKNLYESPSWPTWIRCTASISVPMYYPPIYVCIFRLISFRQSFSYLWTNICPTE
jgi:hypothetical protein